MGVDRASESDFEEFVRRSHRALLQTAWLLTGDLGHAEDIVQGALERTARHWARAAGAPEAYARRAVVNATTDRFRRRGVRVAETTLEPGTTGTAQPDVGTELALRDALLAGVRQLPARQRSVVVLRYFLDLDVHETASTMGVSVGTVTSSTARALARLRQLAPALDLIQEARP